MKHGIAALAAIMAVAWLAIVSPGGAAEPAKVMVTDAWARASGGLTQSAAVYLNLANRGPNDDRLVSARTPVAKATAIHMEGMGANNVMHMQSVDGIDVPAGRSVMVAPGGYHIMLMQLDHALKEGERFPLTLRFAKSGETTVEVAVRPIGATGMTGGAPMPDHGAMPGRSMTMPGGPPGPMRR